VTAVSTLPFVFSEGDSCQVGTALLAAAFVGKGAIQQDASTLAHCLRFLIRVMSDGKECDRGAPGAAKSPPRNDAAKELVAMALSVADFGALPRGLLHAYNTASAIEPRILALKIILLMYHAGSGRVYIQDRDTVIAWAKECAKGIAGLTRCFARNSRLGMHTEPALARDAASCGQLGAPGAAHPACELKAVSMAESGCFGGRAVAGSAGADTASATTPGRKDPTSSRSLQTTLLHAQVHVFRRMLQNSGRFTICVQGSEEHGVLTLGKDKEQVLYYLRLIAFPSGAREREKVEQSAQQALALLHRRDNCTPELLLTYSDALLTVRHARRLGVDADSVQRLAMLCESEAAWCAARESEAGRDAVAAICDATVYCRLPVTRSSCVD
jgi:hypothetical protein